MMKDCSWARIFGIYMVANFVWKAAYNPSNQKGFPYSFPLPHALLASLK